MNQSGRFDFWRMLLYRRAITPPDVTAGLRRRMAALSSVPGWLALPVIATLDIGAALYVGNLRSDAVFVGQTTTTVEVTHSAKPSQPW